MVSPGTPPDREKDRQVKSRRKRRSRAYTYEGVTGWKRIRWLRLGRGMFYDVKRRLPYYWSDIRDALTYRTAASTVRMYFVK